MYSDVVASVRLAGEEKGVRGRFDTLRDKGIVAGRMMSGM